MSLRLLRGFYSSHCERCFGSFASPASTLTSSRLTWSRVDLSRRLSKPDWVLKSSQFFFCSFFFWESASFYFSLLASSSVFCNQFQPLDFRLPACLRSFWFSSNKTTITLQRGTGLGPQTQKVHCTSQTLTQTHTLRV